jgi:hypothetical protein
LLIPVRILVCPTSRGSTTPGRKTRAKATVSEKWEYETAESAAWQRMPWEKKGYKVTRRGNVPYLKKG